MWYSNSKASLRLSLSGNIHVWTCSAWSLLHPANEFCRPPWPKKPEYLRTSTTFMFTALTNCFRFNELYKSSFVHVQVYNVVYFVPVTSIDHLPLCRNYLVVFGSPSSSGYLWSSLSTTASHLCQILLGAWAPLYFSFLFVYLWSMKTSSVDMHFAYRCHDRHGSKRPQRNWTLDHIAFAPIQSSTSLLKEIYTSQCLRNP